MKFWMLPDSGSNTKADITAFLEQYKKENPKEELEVEIFTRQTLWKKLFALVFEDYLPDMPDVVEIPHIWTPLFIKAGLLENLSMMDPGLGINKFLAPLIPLACKTNTKDIYGIPWWLDVTALHYRADHLKLVSKDPASDLSTWEGFVRICGLLNEEFADTPNYFPLQNSDWRGGLSIRNILPGVWSRGTDLFTPDGKKCLFNQKEFVDALEDHVLLAKDGFMPVFWEKGSVGTMMSGKASIFISRRQGLSIFENKKNSFKVKTLPVPSFGQESVSFISGINLAVIEKSRHKESALKLIKWLTSPEKMAEYASKMEVFPALEEKFDGFIFSSPERIKTYAKIVANARTLPDNMVSASATKILNEVLDEAADKVLSGSYTRDFLEKRLVRAAEETDYLLELYSL